MHSGEQVIEYLDGKGGFHNRAVHPFPTLLLLDLKMPVMDGFAVMTWLREHPEIRGKLPVVVLSSWQPADAINRLERLGIQSFLEKPLRYDELVATLRAVQEKWLGSKD